MIEPVHYQTVGHGPALLLLHGGLSNGRATWSVQMQSLREMHRMLVIDRRGHGASPKEPRPYTIAGDAADALAAADRASEQRFHVAALSYGGLVALELTVLAPERVLSLHLIEPPYLSLLPDDPDVRRFDARVREIVAQGRARDSEWRATEFFRALSGEAGAEEMRTSRAWSLVVREAGRLLEEEYAGDYPPELLHRANIKVPVRVYTGGRSHSALRKLARELAGRLRSARVVDVPDAGHGVQFAGEPFDRELLAVTSPR